MVAVLRLDDQVVVRVVWPVVRTTGAEAALVDVAGRVAGRVCAAVALRDFVVAFVVVRAFVVALAVRALVTLPARCCTVWPRCWAVWR
ncbi:hypothetical protein [Luteococcus peritonei]|uniref:Uncharacterized protein n=1 Tax=Luteococcus peritonei TaxID=88874 RepID=A0ABW4RVZ6_9ACTN